MSFQSLGLTADLLRAITDKGYDQPTPIQTQAIPVILEGRDVLAGAQTGTGKTAGFTLPLLQRLSAPTATGAQRTVRALILTPTRELAAQVEESVRTYGKHLPLRSTVIFGGVGFTPQADALRRGVDILVATPGRLLDHVQQRTLDLGAVEILVLDEADRMLDMGFIRDIRKILALLPKQRQNLLFSATYSEDIRQLADSFLHEPALIEVARRNTAAELVTQVVHPVDRERKRELLSHLVHTQGWKQVLVFTRTKHGANRLAEQLGKDGITASAIHGNKSQGARTKALAEFKQGAVRVLVATDIAARGLDIDQLPHVVNYELPNVPEDYVHRIGRTGRAGNEGEAMSLVCVDERDFLRDIERLLKREIPKVVVEGFTPDPAIKAEPILLGRGGGRNAARGGGRHAAPRRDPGQGHSPRSTQGPKPGQGRGPRRDSDQRRDPQARRDGARHTPAGRHQAPRKPSTPYRDEHGDADGNRIPPAGQPSSAPVSTARHASGQPQHPPRPSSAPRHGKPARHSRGRGEVPALLGGADKQRD